ncbi:MAG: ankyrin repeat domain-containing protein [Alphaproteobacteria bacterium]|nr:ankyrin repeat domain-containing protein [Alphaproteobacteria bacterium]
MLNNKQQSRKIRTSLACLVAIFTLIYGEYVFADPQLIRAVESNDIQRIKSLLKQKVNIDDQDNNGKTALIHAVEKGNIEIIRELINYGKLQSALKVTTQGLSYADLNKQDNNGWTALMYAVENGNKEIVKILKNVTANANLQNKQMKTALMIAVEKENLDLVNLLVDEKVQIKGKRGRSGKIISTELKILDSTANPDIPDKNGKTALILAVEKGNLEIIKKLASYSKELNHEDKTGWTALLLAVANENEEVVEILLKNKAGIDIQNNQGQSPLMLAVSKGNVNLVNLLIEKGADVNARDNDDKTALMFAASSGKEDIVRSLLEKKKKKSVIKKMASKITRKKEEGVDIDAKDKDGKTALDYAKEAGHTEVVEMLKVAAEAKKKK